MKPSAKWTIVALFFAMNGCGKSRLPDMPLFVGVDGADYAQGTMLIQSRLRTQFPKGTSERKLTTYLEQQGLRLEPADANAPPTTGVASFKYDGIVCGSQVSVSWVKDAAHSIQEIDVLYSDTGCL